MFYKFVQVNSQLDNRIANLEDMKEDLAVFQASLGELDTWLASASMEIDDTKHSLATEEEPQSILESFQVRNQLSAQFSSQKKKSVNSYK